MTRPTLPLAANSPLRLEALHPRPATLLLPDPSSGRPPGTFWRPNTEFLDELAETLQGQRVLEIFGGSGLLAGYLRARGVNITCTTAFASHDGHERGLYHPVIPLDAVDACLALADVHDTLLMCWPTTTERALLACEAFGPGRPLLYIGEFTDYAKHQLGGCATDSFFLRYQALRPLASYHGNACEIAALGHLLPNPNPNPNPNPTPRRTFLP